MSGRKLMSRGFGESQVTSTSDPAEFEQPSDAPVPREDWTVKGAFVRDHPQKHLITFEMTDQSIELRVKSFMEFEKKYGTDKVNAGADVQDKNDQARKAKVDEHRSHSAGLSLDYKTVLRQKEGLGDGFVHMYVPKDQVDEYRGQDGFEPILRANGEPVAYKDQILTARPKAMQIAEDRQDVSRARRNMLAIQEKDKESMMKQARDANVSAASLPAEDFGLQDDTGV